MKWLRESRNIYPYELQLLDDALTRFYVNPPEKYHEESTAANEDWASPDHVFHRRITDQAWQDAKVLDVGCGPASACSWFMMKNAHYTGVDISKEQLARNRKRFPESSFLEMHWRDIHRLGELFDMVTSFFTLEHIVYPREFLEVSSRCVKQGGFLAVLCPDYLHRGSMPSQYLFGEKQAGIKSKIKKLQWIDALIEVFDRYIIYPRLIQKARLMSDDGGAWLINLRPLCLESESWTTDRDAVYMVGEDEVANYIKNLGFKIIERGAELRKTDDFGMYPEFCYVLSQKPC